MSKEQPEGTDSPTTEWFGQNVDSDAELADELVETHGEDEAERIFDEKAEGAEVEAARRGDSIDPELGEAAYQDDHPEHAADSDSSES